MLSEKIHRNTRQGTDANFLTLRQAFFNRPVLIKEVISGITGFFAISYIIIVNPLILSDAGIPVHLSVFATIFVSVIGCFIMGFWANAPIILTPGMGVNAFFTYTMVINMGLSWQEAIGISLISSCIYMIVAFTPISALLSRAVPQALKAGITAGIGLFLVEIGLEKASLIVRGHSSFIELGTLTSPEALLALFGLVLTLFLHLRNISGSFFIGIIVTSITAAVFNVHDQQATNIQLSNISNYGDIVAKGDLSGVLTVPFMLAVFSMSMILIFESMGVLEGLLPNRRKFKKAFEGSSVTSFLSGLSGTSPTVAAAESAAGIESGGRTGIMAIVAGLLFAASLFLTPLLSYVPQSAIAPVMIITGAIMMEQLKGIDFHEFSEWFPAFLITVLIPFTSSISTGLAFGFVAYPVMKVMEGKAGKMHPLMHVLGGLFLLNLVFSAFI